MRSPSRDGMRVMYATGGARFCSKRSVILESSASSGFSTLTQFFIHRRVPRLNTSHIPPELAGEYLVFTPSFLPISLLASSFNCVPQLAQRSSRLPLQTHNCDKCSSLFPQITVEIGMNFQIQTDLKPFT